jgi:hypothetical protein
VIRHRFVYDSLDEFAKEGLRHVRSNTYAHSNGAGDIDREFKFHGAKSVKHIETLVRDGYERDLDAVLETAGNVVSELFAEYSGLGFRAYHDVSGGEVDIDRFISGIPENMIENQLVETPKFGNIITLVSSISFSASISKESIEKRGHLVAALAIALSRLGMGLEIWADLTIGESMWGGDGRKGKLIQRVLIKSSGEDLDIGRIMYAFTHPSMLRILGLSAMHKIPREDWSVFGMSQNGGYGSVQDPEQDMSEGTIYLPSLRSDHDVPDADVKLREIMQELGIITD